LSNVKFSGVKVEYTQPLSPSSMNASMSANMNVYNPNHYNFKFTNNTIHVIYHDVMVGNISMPAGCNCSSRSPGATFSSHCYSAMNTF
jgi:hypothetical protein